MAYRKTDLFIDLLFTVIGSALVGSALAVFTIPNDIAPGGVSGLSTALAHISPVRVSIWNIVLNVPLLLFAWKALGTRSLVFTILSTVLLSVFIELSGVFLPAYTGDYVMAAVFGGAICGLGIGLLFMRGISTGGTDLLTLIIKKALPNIPNGTMLMAIDAAVVVFAVCVFKDLDVALYSTVTIFACSKVIDALAQGVDYAKVVYAITSDGEKVSKMVVDLTDRGTTVIPATGGYTGEGREIVVIVTRRRLLAQTLRAVKLADPKAFTFVMNTTEVHGEGFKLDN